MYYTVNQTDGRIIDSSNTCPDPQEQADYHGCSVYIIQGEHTGLTAHPTPCGDQYLAARQDLIARQILLSEDILTQ